jgi:hypothetical protein
MPRGEPGEQGYVPEVTPEVLPRKITPEVRAMPLVHGVEALAGAVEHKYAADTETYAGNELADLRLGMSQWLAEAKTNAAPGADGFTGQVMQEFDKRASKYDLSNPYLARAMGPGLNRLKDQFGQEAIAFEAGAGIKYRQQSSVDTTDKLALIAAQHPDQAEDLVGQALKQIRSSRLSPDVELETARYAEATINREAVRARIEADPYGTMKLLMSPENADVAIKSLKPTERDTMTRYADAMFHQRVADAERIHTMAERDEKETASAALTKMIVQSQSPQGLSTADVLKAAPLFRHEPGALSSAMALASGKTVDTDPHIYLPLLQRAQAGEDVSSEAMAGVGRNISKDDAVRLLAIGDKGLPNAHKQALDTIDGYFKQNPLTRWDTEFGVRHEQAKNEMIDWLRGNAQATPEQAIGAAETIGAKHSSLVAQAIIGTQPPPRFLVGTARAPNLDATIAKTRAAELAGQLSHEDAVRQMALIQKWVYAFEMMRPAPKAPQ